VQCPVDTRYLPADLSARSPKGEGGNFSPYAKGYGRSTIVLTKVEVKAGQTAPTILSGLRSSRRGVGSPIGASEKHRSTTLHIKAGRLIYNVSILYHIYQYLKKACHRDIGKEIKKITNCKA
jgi:hypothetical protein